MQISIQNLEANGGESTLHSLLESLLAEHYGRESNFGECTLDEIGQKIEAGREVMELPDWAELKPSFDRCVALYCEILMECDRLGQTLPMEKLGNLLTPQEFQAAPAPNPEDSLEEGSSAEAPEAAATTDLSNFADLSERTLHSLGVTGPLVTAPNSPLPQVPEEPASALAALLSNPVAKEFLQAAHYFEAGAQNGSLPFATTFVNRMTDFSLCACVEAECATRFQGAKLRLWPQRSVALIPLLEGDESKAELVTALKEALNTWASDRPEWLLDGRFPYSAFIGNIRTWLTTNDPARHDISALDSAMLLLLLTQDRPEAGYQLTNWLGARGLTWMQTVEAAFRLCRIYKLRQRVWSPSSTLEESHRILLQEDVQALIPILSKITFADETDVQEAA